MTAEPTPNLPPRLVYETSVQELTTAQNSTEVAHRALAAHWRAMAAHKRAEAEHKAAEADLLEDIARQHEQLAEYVPDAAQAAADLGIMARHHDADHTREIVQQEQRLNIQRDQDVRDLRVAVEGLIAAVGELTAEVRGDRARAERQRVLILQALGAHKDAGEPAG